MTSGDAAMSLDEAALAQAIARHQTVEAFAVASAFAVRNPAHELRAREMIVTMSGRPVTLSSGSPPRSMRRDGRRRRRSMRG